jgi:hypothetical protein
MNTAFIPLAPLYVLLILSWFPISEFLYKVLHDEMQVRGAARISVCLATIWICAMAERYRHIRTRLHVYISQSIWMMTLSICYPQWSWIISAIITNLHFLPHVLWCFTTAKWGQSFNMFGARWHPDRMAFFSLGAYLAHFMLGGPAMLTTTFAGLIFTHFAKHNAYASIMEALFPDSQKVVWCVPHAVSCALAEYSNGADATAISTTVRSKLLRLACLPLPDIAHTALISGTEEVVMFFAQSQPFFEAGAKFVTTPV